jgi:hypothetical protein
MIIELLPVTSCGKAPAYIRLTLQILGPHTHRLVTDIAGENEDGKPAT